MKGKSIFKNGPKVQPKPSPQTNEGFLANINVYTSTGKSVLLSELWEDCTVILKVLPRLGCKFCKYEAKTLDDLGFLVDPNKVKIVAVCFTDPDLNTFLSNGYWSWSIFMDPKREVFRQAECFRVPRWQMFKDLLESRVKLLSQFITKNYNLPNSIKGDPYQLGATFVIAPGGNLLFRFRPSKIAMYPSIKEIYSTLGGDPDDIDELTPITYSEKKAKDMYSLRSTDYSTFSFFSNYLN